jgi:dethiobiotin synthetase
MNNTTYVTGTDTGVGKTLVAGLLARYIYEQGITVVTQKWVQTGCHGFSSDIATHLRIMGKQKKDVAHVYEHVVPYTFSLPASPHLAAREAGVSCSSRTIIRHMHALQQQFDCVIVEGAGGVLVPLTTKTLMIDIAAQEQLPIVLVVDNKLGAINHTLLSLEALQNRRMHVLGMIFTHSIPRRNKTICADNMKIISTFTHVPILGEIPHSTDMKTLIRMSQPIMGKVFEQIG